MNNVITLIADIVNSRSLPKRRVFQKNLDETLQAVNKRSQAALLSPLTITIGDEFQAIYAEPFFLFRDIFLIAEAIFPAMARYSVGIGVLDTGINPEKAIGMDGPAFHLARAGIDELKKKKKTSFIIKGGRVPGLVNSSLDMLSAVMDKWKKNTITAFNGVFAGDSIAAISARTKTTGRSVYNAIRVNHINEAVTVVRDVTSELQGSM